MIEIENVSFYYQGNEQMGAINHLSLSIPKGQVVVLCGESGCGKTTVTRLMNGLIPYFYKGDLTGAVRVNGRDITKMPLYEIAENTGSVFQNPRSQFFNVDTDSELSFACENLGYPKDEIVARVRETVKDFKIERLLGKSLFHLSGGEKQMIACASVCVTAPDVMILDEPSSNLDVRHISILAKIIQKWKAQGKTVIISEHRLYYLTHIADRFVCLAKGKKSLICLRTNYESRIRKSSVPLDLEHRTSAAWSLNLQVRRVNNRCVLKNSVSPINGKKSACSLKISAFPRMKS